MKPAERAAALVRMAEVLEARGAELRELIVAETGSTGFITDFVQAGGSIGMFRSNAEQVQHAVEWVEMDPPTGGPTSVGGSAHRSASRSVSSPRSRRSTSRSCSTW